MSLSVGTAISFRRYASLNQYILSTALHFSISLYSKVPENTNSFGVCYWFWYVFILFFVIRYFQVFTYSQIIMIIIIIIILLFFEFFTVASADSFPLKFEW